MPRKRVRPLRRGIHKASLDKLQIPNTEQKELLAVIESTRPEIVTVR